MTPRLPPTLDRLGDDLGRAFKLEEERERTQRRRRRGLALVAAMLVAAPAAVATRSLLEPSSESAGPAAKADRAIVLGSDASGRAPWRLTAYPTERRGLCLNLSVSDSARTGNVACSRAAVPAGGEAFTTQTNGQTFVFGRVAARWGRVRVTLKSQTTTVTVLKPSPSLVRQSGADPGLLPAAYVAVFPTVFSGAVRPRITPLE